MTEKSFTGTLNKNQNKTKKKTCGLLNLIHGFIRFLEAMLYENCFSDIYFISLPTGKRQRSVLKTLKWCHRPHPHLPLPLAVGVRLVKEGAGVAGLYGGRRSYFSL